MVGNVLQVRGLSLGDLDGGRTVNLDNNDLVVIIGINDLVGNRDLDAIGIHLRRNAPSANAIATFNVCSEFTLGMVKVFRLVDNVGSFHSGRWEAIAASIVNNLASTQRNLQLDVLEEG